MAMATARARARAKEGAKAKARKEEESSEISEDLEEMKASAAAGTRGAEVPGAAAECVHPLRARQAVLRKRVASSWFLSQAARCGPSSLFVQVLVSLGFESVVVYYGGFGVRVSCSFWKDNFLSASTRFSRGRV